MILLVFLITNGIKLISQQTITIIDLKWNEYFIFKHMS